METKNAEETVANGNQKSIRENGSEAGGCWMMEYGGDRLATPRFPPIPVREDM